MKKIGVLDFRIGNISSLLNMINKLGFDAVRIDMSSEINLKNIHNLILPGVGSFDNAMEKLSKCESLKILRPLVPVFSTVFTGNSIFISSDVIDSENPKPSVKLIFTLILLPKSEATILYLLEFESCTLIPLLNHW